MRSTRRRSNGFTLLEALIALGIVAIVTALAVPSFSNLLGESRVSAAARAYASALRKAQAEAIARNRNIEVLFTASEPIPSMAATAVPSTAASGNAWIVRIVGASTAADFIEGFSMTNQVPNVSSSATPTVLGFTPLGRPVDLSSGTIDALPATTVVRFTEGTSTRRFCTYLTTGGAAQVCDPTQAAGKASSCQPALAVGAC